MSYQPSEEPAFGFREFMQAMLAMLDQANRKIAAAQATVERLATQTREVLAPVREWLAANGPKIVDVAIRLQLLAEHAHVENWADLDEHEWLAALELMRADDGVALSWVPPGPVVKALVAAPDHHARNAVLLEHADEVAENAREVLRAITHDDLNLLRAGLDEAWDAWDADRTIAAQATAAVCVSDIVNGHLGFRYFKDFCDDIAAWRGAPPEEWGLSAIRVVAVMCALSTAVQNTKHELPGFNRHATAHRIDSEQYTRANSLRGLMLATSAARELQFALAHEWRSTPRLAPPHPGAIRPIPPTAVSAVVPSVHTGSISTAVLATRSSQALTS